MPIKVRVGQTDAIKILSSAGGGSVSAVTAQNVIGGIASVAQLSVSGISTLSGGLVLTGGLSIDNLVVSGITTSSSFVGPLTGDVVGDLTGDVTGNVTGNVVGNLTGNVTGIADTALSLSGTPNIDVGVINASSLNLTGNLDVDGQTDLDEVVIAGVTTFNNADVVFQGAAAGQNITFDASENDLEFTDNARLKFGNSDDLEIWHQAGNSHIKNSTGDLKIRSDSLILTRENDSEPYLKATVNEDVKIYYNGNEKFATLGTGATVTGDLHVSGDLFVSDDIVLDSLTGNFLNITGLSTFVGDAQFNGNVSIAGTLTYEDVTNIDSVGVVTARSGVRINSGGLVVSSGVATFTSAIDANGGANISGGLVANSLQVSDLTSGRVVLAGASGELEDSTNLTFNGSLLTVTGNHTVTGTLTAGLIDGGSF